jgi:hypothetical protein
MRIQAFNHCNIRWEFVGRENPGHYDGAQEVTCPLCSKVMGGMRSDYGYPELIHAGPENGTVRWPRGKKLKQLQAKYGRDPTPDNITLFIKECMCLT